MVTVNQKLKSEIVQAAPQELLENLGAGISIIDRSMRICWVNKALAQWFGPLSKIKRKFCYNIYQHRKQICPGCPSAKVFQTNTRHSAYQSGFNQQGEKRHYHLVVTPIFNGNGKAASYAMELTYDITKEVENKHQKIALLNRLRRFCGNLLDVNKQLKGEVSILKQKNKLTFSLNKKMAQKYHEIKNGLKTSNQMIRDIQHVDKKIIASAELKSILDSIVKLAMELTHADAAALRIISPEDLNLTLAASIGLSERFIKGVTLKINQGIAGMAITQQKPLVVKDCYNDPRILHQRIMREEKIKSCISVPVILKNEPLGTIGLYFKQPRELDEQEIDMLSIFADQIAIAINEAKLYREVHMSYFNTIHSLSKAMEAKDPYTSGHSDRVTQLAIRIARELKVAKEEIELLDYAGRIHDVGKIGISDTILNKPGKLSLAERALIELHPQKGVDMLTPLKFLRPALPFVLHHHERYDGTGYPHGLKKQQIPLLARILACADSYDAMTSERPYRYRQLSTEEAIGELKLNAGKQFDPAIVNVFISLLDAN